MTAENFTYWLQGFAEINKQAPTEEQWKIIKDHLQLVFKKETPFYPHNGFKIEPTIIPYNDNQDLIDNRPLC